MGESILGRVEPVEASCRIREVAEATVGSRGQEDGEAGVVSQRAADSRSRRRDRRHSAVGKPPEVGLLAPMAGKGKARWGECPAAERGWG